jgi:hypothetical protein
MGRFWRCFLASFCLIRKVLWDGCAEMEKQIDQRAPPVRAREFERSSAQVGDTYHGCGSAETTEAATAAARGNPWIGGIERMEARVFMGGARQRWHG